MNWIKQVMDDREIAVEEMAEILDLAESTVKGYYQGWRKPGKNIRLNIIRILDLDEEEVNESERTD